MTPSAASAVIAEVGKLWPRRCKAGDDPHPWSPDTQDVYRDALKAPALGLSAEQGLAVVRQLKREGEYVPNDRGWRALVARLYTVSGAQPQRREAPQEHAHYNADGSIERGPIKSPREWRAEFADLIRKQIEQACTCARFQSVWDGRQHPLGGEACCKCGGSLVGKFERDRQASRDDRTRSQAHRDWERTAERRVGHPLDGALETRSER